MLHDYQISPRVQNQFWQIMQYGAFGRARMVKILCLD